MAVELHQSAVAAFHGSLGLLVQMSEGTDGAYVELALDQETQPLFIRWALRRGVVTADPPPDGVAWSNAMAITAGVDDANEIPWRMDYDFDADELSIGQGGGPDPLFTIDWPSGWHVGGLLIEAAQIRVWRDDVLVHTELGSFGAMQTRRVLMGGFMKAGSIAGELHLDWLTFADGWLGNPLYYQLVGMRRVR